MNKNISKFLTIFIVFSFVGNTFATNNNPIIKLENTKKENSILNETNILNELELISKNIFSKQNNKKELNILHKKIISLEEKIDTGKINLNSNTKYKFKILAKNLVGKILKVSTLAEKKNEKKEITKILDNLFNEVKIETKNVNVTNVLLNNIFSEKKVTKKENKAEKEVTKVLNNLFSDIEITKVKSTKIVDTKNIEKIITKLLDDVFIEIKTKNINVTNILLNNIFSEKKDIKIGIKDEAIIDDLITKILNNDFNIYKNSNNLISIFLK